MTRKRIVNLRVAERLGKAVNAGLVGVLDAVARVRLNDEGGDYPVKAPLQHRFVTSCVSTQFSIVQARVSSGLVVVIN